MLILRTGSIKGVGNAKVVKTLVAMTTVLSVSGLLFTNSSLAPLGQGLHLSWQEKLELFCSQVWVQATCFVTLERKSLPLCLSFLAVEAHSAAVRVAEPLSSQKSLS